MCLTAYCSALLCNDTRYWHTDLQKEQPVHGPSQDKVARIMARTGAFVLVLLLSSFSLLAVKEANAVDPGLGVGQPHDDIMPASAQVAAARRRLLACPSFTGFVFWPSYDSSGNDIGQAPSGSWGPASAGQLASSCSSNPNCAGFNTNGFFKSKIRPLSQWYVWTSNPCQGLYIKTATTFRVNGQYLTGQEVTYLKWIAQWTVPNFLLSSNVLMSRYSAINDYVAKGTWWTLKEQNLVNSNVWDFSLCNYATGDQRIGPLATCPPGRAWQVGIAGVQVPNPSMDAVTRRAVAVTGLSIPDALGRSALQAGYAAGTPTYRSIVASTGDLQKAWLLKHHLVGFYFVAAEVNNECLVSSPRSWCYGTYGGSCQACGKYANTASSIAPAIDDVRVLLQSLVGGV